MNAATLCCRIIQIEQNVPCGFKWSIFTNSTVCVVELDERLLNQFWVNREKHLENVRPLNQTENVFSC